MSESAERNFLNRLYIGKAFAIDSRTMTLIEYLTCIKELKERGNGNSTGKHKSSGVDDYG